MTISKTYVGYCPTLVQDASIEVLYVHARNNEYIQTGADCVKASFGECPIMTECPIRKSAPKSILE